MGDINTFLEKVFDKVVIGRFSHIAAVKSIYRVTHEPTVIYFIFTSNIKYDDHLMDTLLSIEGILLDQYQYPGWHLSFRYIPTVLLTNINEIIPADAIMVFENRNNMNYSELTNDLLLSLLIGTSKLIQETEDDQGRESYSPRMSQKVANNLANAEQDLLDIKTEILKRLENQ